MFTDLSLACLGFSVKQRTELDHTACPRLSQNAIIGQQGLILATLALSQGGAVPSFHARAEGVQLSIFTINCPDVVNYLRTEERKRLGEEKQKQLACFLNSNEGLPEQAANNIVITNYGGLQTIRPLCLPSACGCDKEG